MELYTYQCYDDGCQVNLWQRWYNENADFQGTHDSIFGILEQQQQWAKPHTKMIKNGGGLIEVCLNGQIQWRIFGYWGSSRRRQFIVVAVGNHKQKVYSPKGILKTAQKRMNDIKSGKKGTVDCERAQ